MTQADMRLERLKGVGPKRADMMRTFGIPDIAALAGLEAVALQRLEAGLCTQGTHVGPGEPREIAALIDRHGLIEQARAILEARP